MLNKLREKCLSCTDCELCRTRTQVVFGAGNPEADLMLVGEAPGEQEDIKGEPFVGRSGMLLTEMLGNAGLLRERDFYITNIVKCRPPGNRDPLEPEVMQCIEYLRRQVLIIKPKVILCVGRVSAERLIGKDYKVTRDHGRFYEKGQYLFMGTFHPAAILRNPNNRPLVEQDLNILTERLRQPT